MVVDSDWELFGHSVIDSLDWTQFPILLSNEEEATGIRGF